MNQCVGIAAVFFPARTVFTKKSAMVSLLKVNVVSQAHMVNLG